MSFDSEADYDATVAAFAQAAVLAGPHRYGNAEARIFVQADDGMKAAEGRSLRATIESL